MNNHEEYLIELLGQLRDQDEERYVTEMLLLTKRIESVLDKISTGLPERGWWSGPRVAKIDEIIN